MAEFRLNGYTSHLIYLKLLVNNYYLPNSTILFIYILILFDNNYFLIVA
jgi:hypothetical protein